MKFLIVFVSIFVLARALFVPIPRLYHPVDEVRAASLGGAPVGLYGRVSDGYYPGYHRRFYPYYGGSDVYAASLGGAKVGLYGRERV